MKKTLLLALMLAIVAGVIGAQTHNAVPINQTELYELLDLAQIRGLLDPLPSTRPYALSLVASSLQEINSHRRDLSDYERQVLDDLIARFVVRENKPFNEDGNIQLESENFPTTLGAYIGGVGSTDLGDFKDKLGASAWVGAYALGDMGKNVSWGVDLNFSGHLVDDYDTDFSYGPEGWEPYTYTKSWDGGLHPLSQLSGFKQMPTGPSFGYEFQPEIAASFWDNGVDIRFGRSRHNWGVGEGSLHLDANARPFFGLDLTFRPFKWISVSSLNGVLEYGENFRNHTDYGIGVTAQEQQNMFSALQIEVHPYKWISLTFFDAAIYLKRPELGYVFPFMSRFLSQNNTGDFDNLMMGGTLALKWPGYFRAYFSVYLDEARFTTGDFLHNPANMYSFQTGIQAPIPGLPWSSLTFQYTKIEPFTYTHYYYEDSPWYTPPQVDLGGGDLHPIYAMDTGYMNGGESLGYGLEPNSDEFMLSLKSQVRRGITFHTRYRMIRHGHPSSVNGSTFDAWGYDPADSSIEASTDPDGAYKDGNKKNFLKDGIYEWYHIITLAGTLDTRRWNENAQFGLSYSMVFLYFTEYTAGSPNFNPINYGPYSNQIRNIVTFSCTVSPW